MSRKETIGQAYGKLGRKYSNKKYKRLKDAIVYGKNRKKVGKLSRMQVQSK